MVPHLVGAHPSDSKAHPHTKTWARTCKPLHMHTCTDVCTHAHTQIFHGLRFSIKITISTHPNSMGCGLSTSLEITWHQQVLWPNKVLQKDYGGLPLCTGLRAEDWLGKFCSFLNSKEGGSLDTYVEFVNCHWGWRGDPNWKCLVLAWLFPFTC